jgi:hypothetical protein
MLIGTASPQWAQDLVDHWIVFNDRFFGIEDHKVFVFYTDFFDYHVSEHQVRIFATPYIQAMEEVRTGEVQVGLFASYIMEGDYQIIDDPKELV